MRRLRRKKDEEEPKVTDPQQPESAAGPFLSAKELENLATNIWNARPIMRNEPEHKFVSLAVAIGQVRPWNQKYDEYTLEQLKTLAEMYDSELVRVREALLRKVD